MSNTKQLTPTVVNLGKHGDQDCQRSGYQDEGGQFFLPPKASKRVTFWQQKMKNKGYTCASW